MRTNTYTVDDIHCGGCERLIRTLVGEVPGVGQIEPDRRTDQVTVTYDETQVDDNAIRQALADAGFIPR